jgi:hypothetical protein
MSKTTCSMVSPTGILICAECSHQVGNHSSAGCTQCDCNISADILLSNIRGFGISAYLQEEKAVISFGGISHVLEIRNLEYLWVFVGCVLESCEWKQKTKYTRFFGRN